MVWLAAHNQISGMERYMNKLFATGRTACEVCYAPIVDVGSEKTLCAINGSRLPYCMSTRRPSDLRGLHTKKAEVLSISQNAATVPIAYAAMTSSRLTAR